MTLNSPPIDHEPTAEFITRCNDITFSWDRGELPFREAVTRLAICRQEAYAQNHVPNEAYAEHQLGIMQLYRGNLATSIQHSERSCDLYYQVGNRARTAVLNMNLGECYRIIGEFDHALELYHQAFVIAEATGNQRTQTMATCNEGLALLALKQPGAALKKLAEGVALAKQMDPDAPRLANILCEAYAAMTTACLQEQDPQAAWQWATEAMAVVETHPQPLPRGYANSALGQVLTVLGTSPDPRFVADPDHYFRAAAEAFREVAAEAELARTTFEHALSLLARGKKTIAARKLQEVSVTFSRLGMVGDAARVAEIQAQQA